MELSNTPDRSLHFCVRGPRYQQHDEYGIFFNEILQSLNHNPPVKAKELLEKTALLMQRGAHKRQGDSPQNTTSSETHGPVGEDGYGMLRHKRIANSLENAGICICPYLVTPIVKYTPEDGMQSIRGYLDAVDNNRQSYSLKEFSYKGLAQEPLKLMTIAPRAELKNLLPNNIIYKTGVQISNQEKITHATNVRDRLSSHVLDKFSQTKMFFFHPTVDASLFNKICDNIDRLLSVINKPRKSGESDVPQIKVKALGEIYWLLAQSTPVERGGSGYANVILEHVAHRLQQQGYNYDLPYTKHGTDLWAEAATTEADTFKQRFVDGTYFDPTLTNEAVQRKIEDIKSQQNHSKKSVINPVNFQRNTPNPAFVPTR